MKRWCFIVSAIVLGMSCQVDNRLPTYPVEGLVVMDENPLSQGNIILDPVDGVGPSVSGDIRQGRFQLQTTAGTKRVEIRASRDTGEVDEFEGLPILEQIIPSRYNVKSELTAVITADGENRLEFKLDSSRP